MNDIIGILNLGDTSSFLGPLTNNRSIASVPFGGRYRLIDFAMSNLVNSGIQTVAVFTLNYARSLMDHLGSGKAWDLNRKQGGLFILPPAVEYPFSVYRGDLQNLYGHIDFFYRSKGKYVIVTKSHMLFTIDYEAVVQRHIDSGADITLLYKDMELSRSAASNCMCMKMDHNRVLQLDQCALNQPNNVYMETFVIEKSLFIQLIEDCANNGKFDINRDLIQGNLQNLNVQGECFSGHLAIIHSIKSYYKHSMELLQPGIWHSLFYQSGLIYTKIKDEPPTKYCLGSDVKHSMIANGCVIEGKVENSILFRGVKVEKGAQIKNSIILQKCTISSDSYIENAILDKDVFVKRSQNVIGTHMTPIVIGKSTVVEEVAK